MELTNYNKTSSISDGIGRLIPINCNDSELIVSLEDVSLSASSTCSLSLSCCNKTRIENILDKSISIDDDNLITPLEPVKLSLIANRNCSECPFPSVLRKSVNCTTLSNSDSFLTKKVSFPANKEKLVSYREPECIYSNILEKKSIQEVLTIYQHSCLKNNTMENNLIKLQLGEIKNNSDRSGDLNLVKLLITYEVLETLEDILQVVNFKTISLIDCVLTPGTIAVVFDLLEYYDPTTELVLSLDLDQLDAWKLFCILISDTVSLESITLKSMSISDKHMKNLMKSINANRNIKSISLDNCTLIKLPNFTLIECLEFNQSINELRLPQTGLYAREADIIGKLLKVNFNIQILDVSNNLIGDRGLEHLAKALYQQNTFGQGVSVLIIFNNQLSEKSGKTINSIISNCKNLRTLNIGFNNLTDSVIEDIMESLKTTRTLEGIGLQSTVLTCKGAIALADAIKENTSLKKINLKGNKAIYMEGLEKISEALITSRISKIELDETNRSCGDADGYTEVVKKIKEICTINKSLVDQSEDEDLRPGSYTRALSRNVSLNCEPFYNTSMSSQSLLTSHTQLPPITSRFSTASPKSRFSVSKVIDSVSKPVNNSRFKVATGSNVDIKNCDVSNTSIVEEEYDNDDNGNGQFKNLRGSISSIDSVESLPTSLRDTKSDNAMKACESE